MNNRFKNMNLGTPAPVAPEVEGVTIREKAKALADDEQQAVRDFMGIAIAESKQFYRNGTKMMSCGEEVALGLRQQYDAMPLVNEALDKTISAIEKEQRVDYKAPFKNVALNAVGVLTGVNGNLLPTGNAMANLASYAPEELDSKLGYNMNLWAPQSQKTGVFRTRNPRQDGSRSCFAVVTEKYTKFDIDDVARELKDTMPADAKGEVFYDGARWSINIDLAPSFKREELGVGRLFRVRSKISGADDRSRGLTAKFQALRIRCINCSTITDERLVFKRKHIGDVKSLFQQAMGAVENAMEAFSAKWAEANKQHIIEKGSDKRLPPEEIFKRLIAHGYVVVPHIGKPALLGKLMEAFEKEPGDGTAADINNAITRLAHEGAKDWRSPWCTEEMEEQAGKLLFQSVYALPALTDKQTETFVIQ